MRPFASWTEGLVNAVLKGATDGFLAIAGASTVTQTAGAPAFNPRLILGAVAINAAIDGARYINGNPLFPAQKPA